jgi:hypothetical protein
MPEKPKSIHILVNNQPVELPDREVTGLEIKLAAGIEPDFTLYHKHGSHLDEISNEKVIKVHEHEEFVAVSGQDVS